MEILELNDKLRKAEFALQDAHRQKDNLEV
jgi:hypothetical protein